MLKLITWFLILFTSHRRNAKALLIELANCHCQNIRIVSPVNRETHIQINFFKWFAFPCALKHPRIKSAKVYRMLTNLWCVLLQLDDDRMDFVAKHFWSTRRAIISWTVILVFILIAIETVYMGNNLSLVLLTFLVLTSLLSFVKTKKSL